MILYINGTKTLAQYQTSNFGGTDSSTATKNENYIKGALVSLELLKDTYTALKSEITTATDTLSWGATETSATTAYSTTFDGTSNNWPTTDAGKLVDGTALAGGLSQKQNKITTGNVMFYDDPDGTEGDVYVPGLVAYDPQTSALSGNKIGILDMQTIYNDEGDLGLYSNSGGGYGSEMDNYVPTVRAVAEALQRIWDNMPSSWSALSWVVGNDNGANRTNAINAYNTTFGNGTNQWAEASTDLINGQFLANSLALKQNKITTGRVLFDDSDGVFTYVPALVSYGTGTNGTDGILGNKIGVLDWNAYNATYTYLSSLDDDVSFDAGDLDNYVPTVRFLVKEFHRLAWDASGSKKSEKAINAYNTTFGNGTNNWVGNSTDLINGQFLANSLALKQNKFAKSGYYYNTSGTVTAYGQDSNTNGWLNAGVKGTGLVTKTAGNGVVGERKIFEATDVANYHADGMSQNAQNIQDISIPTVGAVMTAITNGITAAAPTGTANTLANYDSTGALGSGIATKDTITYTNGALDDSNNIATIAAVGTRQKKKQCGGYEPAAAGQPAHDGTHPGDEDYCWLWIFPED